MYKSILSKNTNKFVNPCDGDVSLFEPITLEMQDIFILADYLKKLKI